MELASAMATHVGLVRPANQDAAAAEDFVFAVADGCGAGGELASHLAVETVVAAFPVTPTLEGLRAACRSANRAVWRRVRDEARSAGTGTTLTAAGVVTDEGVQSLAVASVGDSRGYLFRQGRLQQLTSDHTVVGERVRAGELSEQEAREHPQRAILTRALGLGPDIEPDVVRIDLDEGDRILLSSDGLHAHAEEDDIRRLLGSGAGADEVAEELVGLANSCGGRDNVTVVVVDVG